MKIECVHCGKRYSLRDENAGTQFKCRSCGKISPIVEAAPEEARPVRAIVLGVCLLGSGFKLMLGWNKTK